MSASSQHFHLARHRNAPLAFFPPLTCKQSPTLLNFSTQRKASIKGVRVEIRKLSLLNPVSLFCLSNSAAAHLLYHAKVRDK